jgi:hypothetical protein
MTRDQMQQFARFGAEARLQAISHERDAIFQAFPDLGRVSAQANASLDGAAPGRRAASPAMAPAGKRRGMSAAQRKAVGKRMKAYWAKRRAEKGQTVAKTARKTKRKGGMSAEARKAQGERMKAHWAGKRSQKVNGAGEGTQSETAGKNGAPSRKRGGNARRKQGRKK